MHEFSRLNYNVYINLGNTSDVLWHLIARYKTNNIVSLSPSLGNGTDQYLKIVKEVIRRKLGKSRDVISLPVPGSLALKVHQGFKIFNYKEGTVSKVFDDSIPEATIHKEAEAVKSASRLNFAPKFIREDLSNKSFTEELVIGQLAAVNARANPDFSRELYGSHIVDYIVQMISTDQKQDIQVSNIRQALSDFIRNDYLSGLETTYPSLIEIKRFYNDVCDDLNNHADIKVLKCYSHGDFSLENIIYSRDKVKVIDWEGAESRSILNDYFNYFFTEMYYKRLDTSLDVFESASRKLKERLGDTAVKENINSYTDVYRKLFYLERIKTCLERNITESVIKVTMNSVLLFKAYEALN